jgi:predicted hydrolase (HD superfamily)
MMDQKDIWGLVGLMHDVDWSITEEATMGDDPLAHCGEKLEEILSEVNAKPEFLEEIRSHYKAYKLPLNSMLRKALFAVDELTGLIVAVTLVRPSKVMSDVKVKSVKKKFKDKSFCAAVDRDDILTCETNLGTPIDEFIEITLNTMKEIAPEHGL